MHKQKVHSGLFDQNDCCPLSAMGFVVPHRIKVARDSGIDKVDESESIFRETSPSRLTNDVAAAPSSVPTVRLALGTFELGGEHKLNPGLIIAILVFPVTVYILRSDIPNRATFTIQFKSGEHAFSSRKRSDALSPRNANSWSHLQRRDHGSNPRLL